MKKTKELLRILTERLPPPNSTNHGVLLHPDGTLHIALSLTSGWFEVRLDLEDEEKSAIDLASAIFGIVGDILIARVAAPSKLESL
jgi:hypothetical protein